MKVFDVTPAKGFMQEFVAKTNHDLIGLSIRRRRIEVKTPDKFNDSVMVVDMNTGCHFKGEKLIHTNKCNCGEE